MMRSAFLLFGLCLLAACGRTGEPAPFFHGDRAASTSGGGSSATAAANRDQGSSDGAYTAIERPEPRTIPGGATQQHRVERGDTVYAISRRYNVPIRTLIEANGLRAPYTLKVGQVVTVPAPTRHEVQRGETVYGISRVYGVQMSELTRANGIAQPYTITPGQILVIPEESMQQAASPAAAPAPSSEPSDQAAPQSQSPSSTQTAEGDLPRSTSQPQVWPRSSAERQRDAERIEQQAQQAPSAEEAPQPVSPATPAGQEVPGESEPQPAPQTQSTPQTQPEPQAEAEREPEPKPEPEPEARPEPAEPQVAATPPPAEIPQPAARSSSQFLWPVRGRTIMSFGPQSDGLHSDGINVAAPRGTPIRAAENGVVAYVGNELRGFGNLLLIKHADDWVTAYAHADEILVRRGDTVQRGQTVARVGSTGGVDRPQLHFEVRRGSRAIDPITVLETQQAQAD